MCVKGASNTSGGDSGGGSNGGGSDSSNINSSNLKLKKQKRDKSVQRGLGVAELEKILREQEIRSNNNNNNVFIVGGFSSLKRPRMIIPSYGNGGSDPVLPTLRSFSGSGSSMYGKDPKFSPGYPFLNESSQMHYSPLMLQHKHSQYPPSMVKHSESLSSSNNLSFLPLEHPSNQSSYQRFNSVSLRNNKIVGEKRPWTSSNPPVFENQASLPFPQLQILHQSPSFGNHNAFNLQPSQTFPRDTKMNIRNQKGLNCDLNIFGPSTSSPSELPKYCSLSGQEPRRITTHSGASADKKHSNDSFLSPEGRLGEEEITLGLNIKKDEATGEGINIDLNLKL